MPGSWGPLHRRREVFSTASGEPRLRVLKLLISLQIKKTQRLNQFKRECHFKILWRHMLEGFGQANTPSVGGMRICPINLRIEGCKFEPAILLHSMSAH